MNYYNYFTEIEEHFVRRRGKHLYVSPMDWSLIATWRDSGVPLHVALRGIDRAMDSYFSSQRHRDIRVGTLFYCHASVMEEHMRYLEAHVGESNEQQETASESSAVSGEDREGPDLKAVVEFLTAKISEIKALPRKHSVLQDAVDGIARAASRLEEILLSLETDKQVDFEALDRDLAILDEALVAVLRPAVPREQFAVWEQEAKKELKIYRKKLPGETYNKILENYMRTRVHRHFGIGELSLFHM